MRIRDIRVHIVGEVRNFLFVVVETDDGLTGIGEAGMTWREASVAGFIDALSPALIGQDALRREHLWQTMFRIGFFPATGAGCAALSAIDLALWDLQGKALGVPVYQLLGGRTRDRVVCYPHIRGESAAELAQAAKQAVSQGWQFVRYDLPTQGQQMNATQSVSDGIEWTAAVREAVGPQVEIILDVHTRLDPPQALSLCRGLEPLRPFFVEDPLRSENPKALARLRQQTSVPIAVGEQFATKWAFRELLDQGLMDYCRVDLCLAGGLTESQKIAGWCEACYVPLAPHNPLGPVSTAACLHLDIAASCFAVQECARVPGTVLAELFPVQVPFERGHLLVPERPGLGVEMNEAAVKRYPPLIGQDCPTLVAPDGSFTNW